MKRALLFLLLLLVAGCKVLHPPGYRTESRPDISSQMPPEAVTISVNDSIDVKPVVVEIPDSLPVTNDMVADIIPLPDSIGILSDTTQFVDQEKNYPFLQDSLTTAMLPLTTDSIRKKKGALEATVEYTSKDSIIYTSKNMAFLFGEGNVKYQDIELKSEYIQMEIANSEIFATYGVDSVGNEFGHPVFKQGNEQNMEAKAMNYNFKSRKAAAKYIITKQGEGNIIANIAKKMEDDVINMQGGKYTTCDELEHPHFYIQMTKAKVRPGKSVVSGPAWLVIEDVPLFPVVLPFAWFPFTDTYSSGIIMPTYGDEMNRGFYLRNGGYYLALSDYFDLTLTGEFYTKGSWGISGETSYRKRYKYNGRISFSHLTTITGDKGLDDYSKGTAFSIKINHTQDPKANPYQTVSASVDFSTSSYNRNQLNTLYTSAATQNTKASSISYSRKFPNNPISLAASMNINQRSQDSTVILSLPDMNINMSRIYPFKRKSAIGKDRWYEKISVNYNAQIRNSIQTKENLLFKSNLVRDWKNGINHTANVNATYNFFDVINLSPNFSYVERWYSQRVEKRYDLERNKIVQDTIYGFNRVYNYSGSVSASTTLYGFYKPWKPFQKYVKMIRHRMDPSISFSATPDFGDPKYGSYKTYTFINSYPSFPGAMPDTLTELYSPYQNLLFGTTGRGKSGSVSFSVDNNIEAKIADKNETSGERKISIVDKLSASMSCNLAADTLKWSDLSTGLRLKLTKSYTLNLNMMFDTYMYDYEERNSTIYARRVNRMRINEAKGLGRIGRLKSTGTSFAYTFNNDTFKKWFGGGDGKKDNLIDKNSDDPNDSDYDPNNPNPPPPRRPETNANQGGSVFNKKKEKTGDYDEEGYYNATIPWSFSVNYTLSMGYGKFNTDKKEFDYQFTHGLSFNGNLQPTKNWRITFQATYDVKNKKIPHATASISRTMHCWQMSANIMPLGPMKSYNFSISCNANMLKDLKWDQRSTPYNSNIWY